jgi:hypothetical protein
VARLAPAGLDAGAVAQAAASIEATARLHALTQRILADVGDDDGRLPNSSTCTSAWTANGAPGARRSELRTRAQRPGAEARLLAPAELAADRSLRVLLKSTT